MTDLQWAVDVLSANGYKILIPSPDIIQKTPWSTVYRFSTDRGFVFLKDVPQALSLEPKVIDILRKEFNAPVPQLIANNPDEHCFLMQDAGIKLHEYFKENLQIDLLGDALQDYAELQIKASTRIQLFLDAGVPDWRLDKLPEQYSDLIVQDELLIGNGLTKEDLVKLKNLEPALLSICEKLSRYKIRDTFGHADFHDKNILIQPDTHQATVIDLGEVVITHPFFSLHNCLYMAKENFSLSDEQYQKLQRDSLKPWLALETQENLMEIFTLINQCWSIHAVLGELRLMNSVEKSAFQKLHRQGRISKKLRYWINH